MVEVSSLRHVWVPEGNYQLHPPHPTCSKTFLSGLWNVVKTSCLDALSSCSVTPGTELASQGPFSSQGGIALFFFVTGCHFNAHWVRGFQTHPIFMFYPGAAPWKELLFLSSFPLGHWPIFFGFLARFNADFRVGCCLRRLCTLLCSFKWGCRPILSNTIQPCRILSNTI